MIHPTVAEVLLMAMTQKSAPKAPRRAHTRKNSWACRLRMTFFWVLGGIALASRLP
jgi:hypothetical protein